MSVHELSHLSDAEMLVYMRQVLKDGTAKSVIEGLFNQENTTQRLLIVFVHGLASLQSHVRNIIEASSSEKKLRKFHDTM